MKQDKPFVKCFTISGIIFALLILPILVSNADRLAYRIGSLFSICFLPAVVIAIIVRQSNKSWSWGKVLGFIVVTTLILMGSQQRQHSHTFVKQSEKVGTRGDCSVKVPSNWTKKVPRQIPTGTCLLDASNADASKTVAIAKLQADHSTTINDPLFAKGAVDSVRAQGGKVRNSGATTINGIDTFQISAEYTTANRTIRVLQESLLTDGILYIVCISSTQGSPDTDEELQSIIHTLKFDN